MTKVSPFMGGLGIDARDKLEVAANATVTVGAGSTTPGNVNIGDTGQAAFGQATDLRIFHDGTDSQIVNATGQFNLRGDDVRIENNAGDETGLKFTNGGSVEFYHNNVKKLETTAVGVKTTGNVDVTANVGISGNAFVGTYLAVNNTNPAATDALVVTGNIRLFGGASQLIFADGSTQSIGGTTAPFPTGDYGLLDSANAAVDAFNKDISGATSFDMSISPVGSLNTEDLGAF